MSAVIPEHLVEQQAALIAKRRAVLALMRATVDPNELWALGEIRHRLTRAIEATFPIDHNWWWYVERRRSGGVVPSGR